MVTVKGPMGSSISMLSLVVPAMEETIAALRFVKALKILDFPTLGCPRRAIRNPVRTCSDQRLAFM